jgi:tripartite-type tricarboxylate transporter receptor subunit TctC
MHEISRPLLVLLLVACSTVAPHAQDAGDYPSRPIRVVVPVGAGAGMDAAARLTAAAAESHLGQKFIIENRPGAGSRLGASLVAKSPPDGYTLLFSSPAPIVVSQFFPPKLDFDPVQDFRPVVIGMFQPALLIVRPTLPVNSVDEFIAYAKKYPGKVSFGVQGIGGEMHLNLERFKQSASIDVAPIPYNAGAQAITDLLAGRLEAMFLVVPPIRGHLASGKLRALATINATRIKALPNVPTMAELGRPEMTTAIWFGYLAPSKVPQSVIDKLVMAFEPLRSDAELTKRVEQMGAELSIAGPAEFGKIIASDRARNAQIVAKGNFVKPN